MAIKITNEFPVLPNYEEKIAFIGEAPGDDDLSCGRPFQGTAGALLNKCMREVGIIRQECFAGYVCQEKPKYGKISSLSEAQITEGVAQLWSDLAKFSPTIIVCLGELPLNRLLGQYGIGKWRGSLLSSHNYKCLAAYSPVWLNKNYAEVPILVTDLKKAKKEASRPELIYTQRKYHLNPGISQIADYFEQLKKCEYVAIDFETTRDNGRPLCLGFASSANEAMCIPFGKGDWKDDADKWVMIDRLMNHPVKKVMHNALFDCSVFAVWAHIFPKNLYMDTMLAWHACYPEFQKSLAFVCSVFTNQPYYKEMHHSADESEKVWTEASNGPKLWEYNCIDCCVTHEIVPHLLHELCDLEAEGGFLTDMASLPVALYMTLIGVKLDFAIAVEDYVKNEADAEAVQKMIELAFGRRINTKSPKEMKALLYDELQLPVQYKGVGVEKKVSTDSEALIKLALQGFQMIKLLLKNRQIRTKSSFFFVEPDGMGGYKWDAEKVHKDGRLHPGWNVAGTKTGRWSSSPSILGGRNMMNFPDECRRHFVADE